MKKFALLFASLGLSTAALADMKPSVHGYERVCIAVDAEGYQYLGFDDNAMEDALNKCIKFSDSSQKCRVLSCVNDHGFAEEFSAQ